MTPLRNRVEKLERQAAPPVDPIIVEIVPAGEPDNEVPSQMVRMIPGPDGVKHEYFLHGQEVSLEHFIRITCPENNTAFELPHNGREPIESFDRGAKSDFR